MPATPTSSTMSYDGDDLAVIQCGRQASRDDPAVTSCSGTGYQHHQPQDPPTWLLPPPPPPPADDKPTTPPTGRRCPQPVSVSGPPCFHMDGGDGGARCPLDAAGQHCRRCSAALRAISQTVFCGRRALLHPVGDVTSGDDVISGVVSRATAETGCSPPDCSAFENASDGVEIQQQPPDDDGQNSIE